MFKKALVGSTTIVLSVALFGVLGSGVSGAAPLPAHGTVSCTDAGTGAFMPKLTLPGSSRGLAIKFHGAGTSCTSSATTVSSTGVVTPVTITGVAIKGVGKLMSLNTGFANACATFDSFDTIAAVKVKFVWTATPAIAPTVITYVGGTSNIVSGAITDNITFPATGTTETGSGSFTPPVNPTVILATNISAPCVPGWGPYHIFTFGAGSSISLP